MGTSLALTGPGRLSFDHALRHVLNRRWMAIAGLATTIGGAAYLISTRRPPEPVPDEVTAAESPAGEVPAETPTDEVEA